MTQPPNRNDIEMPDEDAAPRPNGYPIRAVSLMTGVGIDTLRAWERRYNAVTPQRDARGRVYSDDDVRRVRLLHDAVSRGYAIGRVATYTTEQLEQLPQTRTTRTRGAGPSPPAAVTGIGVSELIAATERFDAATVEGTLARAATMLTVPQLLREIVVPVLNEIGTRWHDGEAQIAHEHLLSASVRNVLGSLLRLHQAANRPDAILVATPSGEPHELGALGAAVLSASCGLGTIYLGPGLPAEEILSTLRIVHVDVVLLGVMGAGDSARAETEVHRIANGLPQATELWLGGTAASRLASQLGGRALTVPTYDALEAQLRRIASRV